MVISQLVPFAKAQGIASDLLATMTLVVAAFGNAGGRILSGRCNVPSYHQGDGEHSQDERLPAALGDSKVANHAIHRRRHLGKLAA